MYRNPYPPRWRQALAWLGVALVLALILGIVGLWLYLRSGPAPAAPASPLGALARSAAKAAPPPAPPAADGLARPAELRPPEAQGALAAPAVWDLCGLGRMPVPPGRPWGPSFPQLPSALGEGPLLEALDAAWARLTDPQQAAPREQAAAWRLQLHLAAEAGDTAAVQQARASMHALARDSGDPVIHAWALSHCGTPERPCDAALLAGWQAAEPGNLVPWMIAWRQAPQDRAAAWAGISQATHMHRHEGRWAGVIDAALPESTAAYLRALVAIPLMGIEAATWVPYLGFSEAPCRIGGDADAAERARCDTLARVAAEGSDDLLGLGMAVRHAQRAGWPAEALQPLQAEMQALQAALPPAVDAQPLACAAIEPVLALNARRAAVGERAALRERAQAAGLWPAAASPLPGAFRTPDTRPGR
jgi:hypothetical protein